MFSIAPKNCASSMRQCIKVLHNAQHSSFSARSCDKELLITMSCMIARSVTPVRGYHPLLTDSAFLAPSVLLLLWLMQDGWQGCDFSMVTRCAVVLLDEPWCSCAVPTFSVTKHGDNTRIVTGEWRPVLSGNAGPSASQLQPVLHRPAQKCVPAVCQLQRGAEAAAQL